MSLVYSRELDVLDAAILSAHAKSPWGSLPDTEAPIHVTFVDLLFFARIPDYQSHR
jgi:hypothetical protein